MSNHAAVDRRLTLDAHGSDIVAIAPLRAWVDPGEDVGFSEGGALSPTDLLIRGVTGQVLPSPPGVRMFLGAIGGFDGEGALHLLWAEPDDPERPFFGNASLATLADSARYILHATFRDGEWGEVRRVHGEEGVFWNTLGHYSEVIRDERGDLHAVLATRETGGVGMTSPLMHVRTGPHGTHVTELPGLSRGGSGYPSLAASADGRLWLASIGAGEIDGVRYSSNTLFIQHSPDGGGTWSTPATVRGVEDSFVADARIVHAAGDTLHMVWSEMAEPPLRSGLLHAVSSDGGSTWSDPERVPVASGWNVNRPILTATARGGVHLTYTVITGGSEPDVNLWQNVFVDGEFAPPQRIENDSARIVHNFGYLIDDSGRQHLVWTHHQKPPHPELGFRDQRMSYTFREACVGPAQH